jgi:hypothetical protein
MHSTNYFILYGSYRNVENKIFFRNIFLLIYLDLWLKHTLENYKLCLKFFRIYKTS